MEGVKMVYFGEKMVSKWYMKKTPNQKQKNICDLCPFISSNKKDFVRHLKTKKHFKKWYMTFGNDENGDCDHNMSINQYDNDKNAVFGNKKNPQKNPKKNNIEIQNDDYFINSEQRVVCLFCNKSYKYKSGFYRHKKKCIPEISNELSLKDCKNSQYNTNEMLMKVILKATETNNKLCERIVALENTVASSNNIVNNTITNNINKQELNINVFLNNECKNAMNLKDFLHNINLNLEDLDYTANNGYIKGITNIFIKNLEEMALNERPIHSIQDDTNHQFYIKDENKWECDNKDEKLQQSIDCLTKRQINKIKDWESQHPNWENSDAGIEEYMKIVQIIMGGGSELEREHNKELIKKELVDKVKLKTLSI